MRFVVAILALALASCAGGPNPRDRYARLLTPTANPSKVVAAELAFARAAQEKGQWTAFREFATDDAVMFVPEPVNAREWLKKQADPAEAVKWQPHEVWSSCDGSVAVTKGAWQRPNGTFGYFTTVWQRQKDGEYKWVLDQGDVLAEPLIAPEFIQTGIADCAANHPIKVRTEHTRLSGTSEDASLNWTTNVSADGARTFVVEIMRGQKSLPVIDFAISSPAQ